MPKPKIRPPRTPNSESAKVTIANQAKNIRLLISRCETLENQMRASNDRADKAAQERGQAFLRCDEIQEQLGRTAIELNRLRGYQERVREEDKHRYGDLGAGV